MPSDVEFERALRTRDCYAFKRGIYLLTTLENSWHAKDLLDFSGGIFSIALTKRETSREMSDRIGSDRSSDFEKVR